ncbi:MAG TPA: GNAT family N-acetyltransferase [Solirubrobacteraceae bacterium]|jgi:acyl-CoA synthetase (NDP forming)/RimJ/RimL family protein N-acetyltransferase
MIRDVILRDGTTLRLRSPAPDDHEAIQAFFDGLDRESLYLRFHGYGSTAALARYYAEADGDARVALLAHLHGRIVAVAGYDRLREPGVAEVAFAVSTDLQGRGAGTRLLEQLAGVAATQGIHRFDAEVLSDNRRMLGVFRSAGFDVRRHGFGGEVRMALDIRPTARLAERIAERDHSATVASLAPMLRPRSVAVVGASNAPGSVGGAIVDNIVAGGFEGVVYPVNRTRTVVRSIRAADRISDLPEIPDLAVLAIPAEEVLEVAEEAAAAGVRALVVVAAGFSDASPEGAELEDRLLARVREHGLRMLGPNSLGLLRAGDGHRLDATISRVAVPAGQVAISSQSGALGIALLGHAAGRGLGVAAFVALGNRADVSTNDLLEVWEEDPDVAIVLLYMESFGNPGRFSQISRRVSRRKPILAVKGQRTRPAEAGSASHTAAAFRTEAGIDALFRQAGVLPVAGTQELFDAAALLAAQPPPPGRRVAILTNSGGLGTVAADACQTRGLRLAEVAPETAAALREALPRADRTSNPIDMGIAAGPADYTAALRRLLADDAVDAAVVLYVEIAGREADAVVRAVAAEGRRHAKPIAASILEADGAVAAASRAPDVDLPTYRFPEACAGVLALAADRRDWLSRPLGQAPVLDGVDGDAARALAAEHLARAGAGWAPTATARALLATHGVSLLASEPCDRVEAAVAAAERAGGPVALKAHFAPPADASDIDAVLLGLEGGAAIETGWRELERRVGVAGRAWAGAVVQPLVPAGIDVLVGSVVDPDLGPLVALGLGGRQAGLLGDTSFRLLPLTDLDITDLVASSRGVAAALRGYRGAPALDADALADLVARFAALVAGLPELRECDLNPVRVLPEGCVVLDARLRLGPPRAAERLKTW